MNRIHYVIWAIGGATGAVGAYYVWPMGKWYLSLLLGIVSWFLVGFAVGFERKWREWKSTDGTW